MLVRAHKEIFEACKHSELWMEHHNLVVESTWHGENHLRHLIDECSIYDDVQALEAYQ